MTKNYLLVKEKFSIETTTFNNEDFDGFKFKPLNRVKYDGIVVNEMILIKPSFIEKVLKKKIKRKLESYLQYIISIIDNEEDSDITGLRSALNDLTRYKDIVNYRYQKYLDEKYINLLLKKMALLEHELKLKIIHYKEPKKEVKVEENNHRRRR
ncbi:MAG: hypothetical protein PHD10_04840 [Bacilli bacterium]|nr:hypothetical protein [Bacilli bacterium]MDD4608436.1 hypothetical protein [Bacilli bacterium]